MPNPDQADIAAGTVLDIGSGQFARRQEVVYSGVYLNEISRIDIAQSRFTADFYLWVRFARSSGTGAADPTEIDFPDLVRGKCLKFFAFRLLTAGVGCFRLSVTPSEEREPNAYPTRSRPEFSVLSL